MTPILDCRTAEIALREAEKLNEARADRDAELARAYKFRIASAVLPESESPH